MDERTADERGNGKHNTLTEHTIIQVKEAFRVDALKNGFVDSSGWLQKRLP